MKGSATTAEHKHITSKGTNTPPSAPSDAPAATRVLDIAELLETILLHLPLQDLLLSQRVCKTWKGMFDRSHRIQKALFLKPVSDIRVSLAETYFTRTYAQIKAGMEIWQADENPTTLKLVHQPIINPLLSKFFHVDERKDLLGLSDACFQHDFEHDYNSRYDDDEAVLPRDPEREDGATANEFPTTLSRMMVISPPLRTMRLEYDYGSEDGTEPLTNGDYSVIADLERLCIMKQDWYSDCSHKDHWYCWECCGLDMSTFVEVGEVWTGWEMLRELKKRNETESVVVEVEED